MWFDDTVNNIEYYGGNHCFSPHFDCQKSGIKPGIRNSKEIKRNWFMNSDRF